jgi:hypothetical protein
MRAAPRRAAQPGLGTDGRRFYMRRSGGALEPGDEGAGDDMAFVSPDSHVSHGPVLISGFAEPDEVRTWTLAGAAETEQFSLGAEAPRLERIGVGPIENMSVDPRWSEVGSASTTSTTIAGTNSVEHPPGPAGVPGKRQPARRAVSAATRTGIRGREMLIATLYPGSGRLSEPFDRATSQCPPR